MQATTEQILTFHCFVVGPCMTYKKKSPAPLVLVEQVWVYIPPANFNSNDEASSIDNLGANANVLVQDAVPPVAVNVRRFDPGGTNVEDFQRFVTHPVKIYHATWNAATAGGVIAEDLVDLWHTAVSLTPMGAKISHFNFFKADIKIKIVVQGQPFAAGQIVFAFEPLPRLGSLAAPQTYARSGITNDKIQPHLIVDPSKTQSYELILPVCTPTGVYSQNTVERYGSYLFRIRAYNPLTSGTATAPNIGICVYMSLVNPVFEGLTMLSGDFVEEKKPGGLLSGALKGIGKYSPLLKAPFPALGPGIDLFSAVAGTFGDVAAFFGFSKPPVTENQCMPLIRVADNYTQFDGLSIAPVLAGSQTTSLGISSSYGGGNMDELLLANLCNKPGLMAQFTIAPAVAAETLVTTIPMSPTVNMLTDIVPFRHVTPIAGVAAAFEWWTGDLIFTAEIVASVFHRATLLISWDPNPGTVPTFNEVVQTCKNVTVNVSGNTAVKIRIPWQQPQPFRKVKYPTLTDATDQTLGFINGAIKFWVINSVTSNGSTDGIAVNCYLSSDNIKFQCPDMQAFQGSKYDEIVMLSGDFCPVEEVDFGPKTDISHHELRSFGESYTSVKQLTSKINVSSTSTITIPTTLAVSHWYSAMPNKPLTVGDTAFWTGTGSVTNLAGWFAQAYLGYRGGMRWSIHASEDENGNVKPHFWTSHGFTAGPWVLFQATLDAAVRSFVDHYAWTVGNRAIHPNADIVCPSLFPFDYVPTRVRFDSFSDRVEYCAPLIKPAVATDLTALWCSGTADDANFVWFLGFPVQSIS
jgi:hypothetical protein